MDQGQNEIFIFNILYVSIQCMKVSGNLSTRTKLSQRPFNGPNCMALINKLVGRVATECRVRSVNQRITQSASMTVLYRLLPTYNSRYLDYTLINMRGSLDWSTALVYEFMNVGRATSQVHYHCTVTSAHQQPTLTLTLYTMQLI